MIVYSRWDRSPDIIEDQVTYPIVDRAARRAAGEGRSAASPTSATRYVYVIFQDGTDLYWARSRVLEYLSKILPRLPEGVRTELGPDATSVGWVYQYALVDRTGRHDLAELRSLQDWYLRYHLQAVPGRRRGRRGRRLREAVPGQRRPEPAARLRRPADRASSTPSARATTRSAAGCSSSPAPSSWCAGAATCARSTTSSRSSSARRRRPARRSWCGNVARVGARARHPPRRRRPRRRGRHGRRHRRHAPRRERARRHRAREGAARRARGRRCPTGVEIVTTYDRSGLIHRADRHAAARADRGDAHRQRW